MNTEASEDDIPITERTRAILAAQKQVMDELQNVTGTVREIQKLLAKRESRWTAFIRSLKQFLSLIE